jgi:hypothetical protein
VRQKIKGQHRLTRIRVTLGAVYRVGEAIVGGSESGDENYQPPSEKADFESAVDKDKGKGKEKDVETIEKVRSANRHI